MNGGYEEENTCTEYLVECAPEAWISNTNGFNNYFKDANRARAGERCLAIEAGHSTKPYYRTFVRSRLLCGLRKGHAYRLHFFIKSPHDILDSIGVLFTSHDFLFDRRKLQSIAPTHFISAAGGAFRKDSSWQEAEVVFMASGEESFITIANFSRRDITGDTHVELVKNFFVFLDDVSLRPLDPNEQLCANWQKVKEEVYAQNERHRYLQLVIRQHRNNPPVVKSHPTAFVRVDTLWMPDVLFDLGKASLKKESHAFLDTLAEKLKGKGIDSIVVNGHTDNLGTFEINERLSLDRANAVIMGIKERISLPSNLFFSRGFADLWPVADNNTPEGRQQNRRVEVLVYLRE